ncbi:MAG: Ldh family oxidoreductase [Hespellia sp.]|nr:Ldh family oxidoreductase [Hespellia sp.]
MNFEVEKTKVIKVCQENGIPLNQAEIVADVMVTADMYGVNSHGTSILDAHIQRVKRNGYNLNPNFMHLRESTSFVVIDGDNAFGFVSASYCMNYAIAKAKEVGVFQVFSRNNNTFGPAFYYSLKAAEQGLIGIIMSNSPAQMALIGGKDKMLGTNPFSVVFPVPSGDPIIIDMATSVVAKSKFKQYKEAGKLLPDDWALDKNGVSTNDPDEGMQGFVQPMAGYKGQAIAMMIDVLSGVISGASYLNRVGRFYSDDNSSMNVGFCCVAIDPEKVLGEEYSETIKDYITVLRNCQTVTGENVSLPGDRKLQCMLKNARYKK